MVKGSSEAPPTGLPYATAGSPYSSREKDDYRCSVLNLQICTCGHDRTCHGFHLGKGKERRVIVNCTYAGRCCCIGCACTHFVFSSTKSSQDGNKRRQREIKDNKVVPPSED